MVLDTCDIQAQEVIQVRMQNNSEQKGSILIVEDDRELAMLTSAFLKQEGYDVDVVHSGEKVAEIISQKEYDILVLDWMLPGKEGVDIIKEYRQTGGVKGIIMVTGNRKVDDIERGIDSGADDYLTKPFSMKELSARVRALQRRPLTYKGNVIQIDDVSVDVKAHVVKRGDEEIHLFPREFALLKFLMSNPGVVFSPENLLNYVWEAESDATPDSIRTNIRRIRQKIAKDGEPCILVNVHGVGYKVESQRS
ncbi:MAG: response regulator transcription factor [Candidatus Obscuribacterales bacterium]|nr:response regulator transcription factor [Candidatus Obscuribacterales bacterium]